MCRIDEKATIDFKSIKVIQIKEDRLPPINKTLIKRGGKEAGKRGVRRNNPNNPSFNKMEAKYIEPNVEASTCARGSHIWIRNIGSLHKKGSTTLSRNNHEDRDGDNAVSRTLGRRVEIGVRRIRLRKGKEHTTVYKHIAEVADNRSGAGAQMTIIKIMKSKVASKEI